MTLLCSWNKIEMSYLSLWAPASPLFTWPALSDATLPAQGAQAITSQFWETFKLFLILEHVCLLFPLPEKDHSRALCKVASFSVFRFQQNCSIEVRSSSFTINVYYIILFILYLTTVCKYPVCLYINIRWMATHSSILVWRIPWTEELGRLQFMGLQRVRHDWVTNIHIGHALVYYNEKLT